MGEQVSSRRHDGSGGLLLTMRTLVQEENGRGSATDLTVLWTVSFCITFVAAFLTDSVTCSCGRQAGPSACRAPHLFERALSFHSRALLGPYTACRVASETCSCRARLELVVDLLGLRHGCRRRVLSCGKACTQVRGVCKCNHI